MMNNTKLVLALCIGVLVLLGWEALHDVADAIVMGTIAVGYVVAHVTACAFLENSRKEALHWVMIGTTLALGGAYYVLHTVSIPVIFSQFGVGAAVLLGLSLGVLAGIWAAPSWILLSRRRNALG